jgi:hypothetical protein
MQILILFLNVAFAAVPNVPKVSFDFWNARERVHDNNCYNYGTNRASNDYAQPGAASGSPFTDIECAEVYRAASSDLGLSKSSYFPMNGKNEDSLIALVVSPGYDFHWYRRGDDGMWTHKMGGQPATKLDHGNKLISNPETADRGSYTDFCGYFRIKNFVYQPDEQDGGFVRIGYMGELPAEPIISEVTVLMYSGRPNPRYPLKDYLGDPAFKKLLEEIRGHSLLASVATASQVSSMSKLGGSGILVLDREGLIFPKGYSVQIFESKVLIQAADGSAPRFLLL